MSEVVDRLNAVLTGRYRVERRLGEGGMATVYLADDLRHDRKVAFKVLKPELAAIVGADRFLAEIRTTANLQHPHILPLFDSGEADGFLFFVMPYVAGGTLSERLDRERQLPIGDAVRIATQVAEALAHAHERGVVHRDIKPGNILLRGDDAMVADFGIALAAGVERGALTQTGVSVGTPRYMSPEQATGDTHVGPPSDVWSLGCVLYEMLAGAPPYDGVSPQAILGRIVSGATDPVAKRRRTTPPHVAATVTKALETVAADRFESARDFALALNDPHFRHGEPRMANRVWKVVAAGVGLYVLGLATSSLIASRGFAREADEPVYFSVPGPSAAVMGRAVAISRDGRLLVDAAPGGNISVRRIGNLEATSDLGQLTAIQPFFSADGTQIAYFGGIGQTLTRIPVMGGTPSVIVPGDGARAFGGTWTDDGTIVFATSNGVYRVSPDDGQPPRLLIEPDSSRGILLYSWPQSLPGRRAVLLTVVPRQAMRDGACSIAVLDLDSGALTEALAGGSGARYASTGHLLFSADGGALHAVAFDRSTYRTRGERVRLPVDGLSIARGWGADFDISADGDLIWIPANRPPSTLAWIGRDGRVEPAPVQSRNYGYPRVSPDGRRIAVDVRQGTRDIVVLDLPLGTTVPIDDGPGEKWGVEWSIAGDSLYYTSNQGGGTFRVYRRAADGSGQPQLVYTHDALQAPQDITPDGARLIVLESRPSQSDQFDIMALTLEEPVRRDTVLSTPAVEYNASLSPDGRFIAYQTYESNRAEVYVRPMDTAWRERARVSVDGGEKPLWSPTGDTIFYRSPADSMMAAAVATDPAFRVHHVSALFAIGLGTGFGAISGRPWDVSPVDGRFIVARSPTPQAEGVRVALNWTAELRRLMQQ
jgi:serine/threonine-protein kinase